MSYISGLVQKQQTFLSSGTFTPSAAHLAAGGSVNLFMVGGGGGGAYGANRTGGGGGSVVSNVIVQVAGACTVAIGAGGAGGVGGAGATGGTSSLYLATALTTLGVAITSTTATTFTATSGAAITNGSIILIDSEEMLVTGIAANVVTVTRGYRNTTAATHLISTSIYASYLTALGGGGGSSSVGNSSGGTISSSVGGSAGGGAGGPSATAWCYAVSANAALWAGGPALFGYGAGGSQNKYALSSYSGSELLPQTGTPSLTSNANQIASTPNTGAGGNGGYMAASGPTYYNGGAGGSGICIITYSE